MNEGMQIAKRLRMVASRWSWVPSGGVVLLGNGTVDCDVEQKVKSETMWLTVRWRAKCCVLQ